MNAFYKHVWGGNKSINPRADVSETGHEKKNKHKAQDAAKSDMKIAKEYKKKLESEGFKKLKTDEAAELTTSAGDDDDSEDDEDESDKKNANRLTIGIGTYKHPDTGEVKEVSDFPPEFK